MKNTHLLGKKKQIGLFHIHLITKCVIERYHLFTLFERKIGVTLVSEFSSAIRIHLFITRASVNGKPES